MRFVFLMAFLSLMLPTDLFIAQESECSVKVQTEKSINPNINIITNLWNVPVDERREVTNEVPIDVKTVFSISTDGLKVRNNPSKKATAVNTLMYGSSLKVDALVLDYGGDTTYYKVAGTSLYVPYKMVIDREPMDADLDVTNILQNPELPDGCEITSLTIVMNYIGETVDKCYMSDKFLPKSNSLDADPNEYHLRDPKNKGFYCFAGPLVKAVDAYNEETGKDLEAVDLTGCEPDRLYEYVLKGQPVVVWGTLHWNAPRKYENGLYSNLHCMVLSGVNESTVKINDPIYGITYIDRAQFEDIWIQMERRAMTVYYK